MAWPQKGSHRPCPIYAMGPMIAVLPPPFPTPSFWSSKIFGAGHQKFFKDMQVLSTKVCGCYLLPCSSSPMSDFIYMEKLGLHCYV